MHIKLEARACQAKKTLPAFGILIERMFLTFPSQPITLISVAVENRRAGPTHKRDLKFT